ncbi:hypothetical protein SAMN02983003_0810 [Devosia enhydra]|uniref:Uncharacterized protein n=1 Tax=Devosia enhydra TaxID=665118 RepID=A0A1K2HUL3_9HYPH|nr:hypothetical protein [Devosia enhydra]SFZ81975.1 hypothetical protein SAMN02983003_0810 [Devosia enhydra]
MKLTWFGGSTLRVHLGGRIVVVDEEDAPDGIDRAELLSGADFSVGFASQSLPGLDPRNWQPPRSAALLDDGQTDIAIGRLAADALLVSAAGEPPLVLAHAELPEAGRWTREAVVVAFSVPAALSGLKLWAPRLIALAVAPKAAETAFSALAAEAGGTGLMLLEPGLALEV